MLYLFIGNFPFGGRLGSELEVGMEVSEGMGVIGLVLGIGEVEIGCGLASKGLGLKKWVGLFGCWAWSDGIVGISIFSSFGLVCGLRLGLTGSAAPWLRGSST